MLTFVHSTHFFFAYFAFHFLQMADDTGPSHIVQSCTSQEAIDQIAKEMVVETAHNLIEAWNSAARYYYNHYHKVP